MLAQLNSRELVEWFAFLELEREAMERMREDAARDSDTGAETLGVNPDDPLGLGQVGRAS